MFPDTISNRKYGNFIFKKMSSTVSYHLPSSIKKYIEVSSEKKNISRGKFLVSLVQNFAKISQENKDLKAYLNASADQNFLAQEMQESDLDLAVEHKYNSSLWSK